MKAHEDKTASVIGFRRKKDKQWITFTRPREIDRSRKADGKLVILSADTPRLTQ